MITSLSAFGSRHEPVNALISIRVVVIESTLKGPVPIGALAKTSCPAVFQAFGATMYRAANLAGKIASGVLVVMSTTYSLTLFAPVNSGSSVEPITVLRPSALTRKSIVAFTASALNSSPLENLTPWRKVKRHVVLLTVFQYVARRARTIPLSSTRVRASKIAA